MRVELRTEVGGGIGGRKQTIVRGMALIAESQNESAIIDQVMGNEVGKDGFIGRSTVECRLSDGYADHYLFIPKAKGVR